MSLRRDISQSGRTPALLEQNLLLGILRVQINLGRETVFTASAHLKEEDNKERTPCQGNVSEKLI